MSATHYGCKDIAVYYILQIFYSKIMLGIKVINAILEKEELKAATFAKSIGITPTQVYDLLSGKTKKVSIDLSNKILDVYPQYSKSWLLTGEGSMLIEDSIVPESTTVDKDDDEKAELIKIIEELRKENSRLVETNERLSRVVDRLLDEKEGRVAI